MSDNRSNIINFPQNGHLRIMENPEDENKIRTSGKIQILKGDNKIRTSDKIKTSDEIPKLEKDINEKDTNDELKKINDIPIAPDFLDFILNNERNYSKIPPGVYFPNDGNMPIPRGPNFR